MRRDLFKWKWNCVLALIPKYVPRLGRLHLPLLSAKWNICQSILLQNEYRLQRYTIWYHWDKGWPISRLSPYGKILWKWQQCSQVHAVHTKPLVDKVKENSSLLTQKLWFHSSFSDSSPTTMRVEQDFKLDMNPQMSPIGATTRVHVQEISQPCKASLPHHLFLEIIQTMLTASSPSHNPLALLFSWSSWAWILRIIAHANMIF